jgi:hypothetical protein
VLWLGGMISSAGNPNMLIVTIQVLFCSEITLAGMVRRFFGCSFCPVVVGQKRVGKIT